MHSRKAKLTPAIQQEIVKSLSSGAWFAHACEAAGVDRETGRAWIRRGQGYVRENTGARKWKRIALRGPEKYAAFADAVRMALAKSDTRDQQLLAKHALEDWRAAAYRQERRNPKIFGERVKVEVEAKVQKSLDAFLKDMESDMTPQSYAELVNAVAKRMGVQPGGGT